MLSWSLLAENVWAGETVGKYLPETAIDTYTYLVKDEFEIAKLEKNGQVYYGVVGRKDKEIIPFLYKKIVQISANRLAVTNQEDKIAIFGIEGDQLSEFELDNISKFEGKLARTLKNGKLGLINIEGKEILPPEYKEIKVEGSQIRATPFPIWKMLTGKDELIKLLSYDQITPIEKNTYLVTTGDMSGIISQEEKIISPVVERKIYPFENHLAVFETGDNSGVLQDDGKLVLKPVYDSVLIAGKYLLALKKGKENGWTIYNLQGDSVTQVPYQNVKSPKEGYLPIKRNGSWGFINDGGEEVIPNQYDTVESFIDSMAKARYVGSEGVINKEGEWLIRPRKDHLEHTPNDIFYFRHGNTSGLIKPGTDEIYSTTNELIKLNYGFLERNAEGKFGLVSGKGKIILSMEYDYISSLQEDSIYIFRKEGQYGIITRSGKTLVGLENNFQELHPMSEGYLGVKINNKFGFVDMNGDLRVANRYEGVGSYNNGMAPIKLNGKWGYIDKIERLKVQPYYDKASDFSDGMAIVMQNGQYGLVNRKGGQELDIVYDSLLKTPSKRFIAYKNGRAGLVSETGRLLISPKYDHITDLENGYVIIKRNDKYGLATIRGVNTIPLVYDEIIYDEINDIYLARQKQQDGEVFTLEGVSVK